MNIFNIRLQRLHKMIKDAECDGFIVDNQTNLYYLTGLSLSAGKLLIDQESATLFVDARYYEICKKSSPFPVILAQTPNTFLEHISSIKILGFDSNNTSFSDYLTLEKKTKKILKGIEDPVLKLRMVKDEEEVIILKVAAALGSEGYDHVVSLLKEGMTEAEIAIELEIFWKRRGSKGMAFDPIIAFGPNSSMPHYSAGKTPLQRGQPVLIDIGVNLNHYHSDMTRVVFFGNPDPRILEIYEVVKQAQEKALEICSPGTLVKDLDKVARESIESQGYGKHFTHSLGHGVGLDIHELPTIRNTTEDLALQTGMVITIEPGVYLPDIGGVRIEDTVVITKNGHENLTNRSKEITIV